MNDSDFIDALEHWWNNDLKKYRGMQAKGTVAGALIVFERLSKNFSLRLEDHLALGKAQIKGVSGVKVQAILRRFGENRPFLSEGGRTNRGLAGDIDSLLTALGRLNLELLSEEERNRLLTLAQKFLVEKVTLFFNRVRLSVIYDPTQSTWGAVRTLLDAADERRVAGPVAEYLVGAKLSLRFPYTEIENKTFSTSDEQTGRPGDFIIGDTAFHVTVHATLGHYQRCQRNLEQGLRVYLIVQQRQVDIARHNSEELCGGKVSVQSIESFVSQNIDELGAFSTGESAKQFALLLQKYNERVDAVELDKSLLLEIPANLYRYLE